MNKTVPCIIIILILQAATLSIPVLSGAAESVEYPDPATRFVDYIEEILEAEKDCPPPKGAIVCVGSSSMRGWEPDIDRDLYPLTLIKRGFGGSNFADALYHLDALVLAHDPRAILVYEGDNDVGGVGVTPEKAFQTAETFIDRIHKELPDCRIYFISVKPSPIRWDKWPVMNALNKMLADRCDADERLFFLDIGPVMMNEDGVPANAIFKQDLLHMNRAGYELWKSVIRPVLLENELPFE